MATQQEDPRYPGIYDFVMLMLGYPTVAVELTCEQIEACVKIGVKKWCQYQNYDTQIHKFDVSPGVNGYDLSSVIDDLHKDLIEVYYNPSYLTYDDDSVYLLINQYYYYFRSSSKQLMSDYYLFKGYIEDLQRSLGVDGTWKIMDNKLWLFPEPTKGGKVGVLYRSIPPDGYIDENEWIMRYTLALAKGILAQARGKFTSGIMGPSGVINFNASELQAQSVAETTALILELRMRAKPVGIIRG